MEWEPISLEDLQKHIKNLEFLFAEDQKSFWALIRITPEKWSEETTGEEGGGFWVVAIFGRQVIYYNDIEDGFNISAYPKYGVIQEYYANQSELHHVVGNLFDDIKKGNFRFG
jgi:hypothetical protein